MAKDKYLVLRGVVNYAKLLGEARPHKGLPKYDKGPYWSVDFSPDAESLATVMTEGLEDKLREPNAADENRVGNDKFISLRVLENRADGKKNHPPKVVDIRGKKWEDNVLIGNGSVVDIKVKVVDYGKASDKGCYLQAVRVLKLVPYESNDFAPLSPDDEFNSIEAEDQEVSEDDLDDDIPF